MPLTSAHALAWLRPNNNKVRMPSDKWFGLDAASKATWDRLDDKAKSIILGYTKPDPSRPGFSSHRVPFGKPPPGQPSKPPCRLKLIFMRFLHMTFFLPTCMMLLQLQMFLPMPMSLVLLDNPDDTTDIRLINAAKSHGTGSVPPGDIRRVMSKSSTRRINSTCLEYYVSKHEATHGP